VSAKVIDVRDGDGPALAAARKALESNGGKAALSAKEAE